MCLSSKRKKRILYISAREVREERSKKVYLKVQESFEKNISSFNGENASSKIVSKKDQNDDPYKTKKR